MAAEALVETTERFPPLTMRRIRQLKLGGNDGAFPSIDHTS